MTPGFLTEKKGYYYCVLNYRDDQGRGKKKWIATGIPAVRGNKRKAEAVLDEVRHDFVPPHEEGTGRDAEMLFADYLESYWLPMVKNNVQITTYVGYRNMIESIIAPFFRERGVKLQDLSVRDIQEFYTFRRQKVKGTTVIHNHAVIHKALDHAMRIGLIPSNPSDLVERPRKGQFIAEYYTPEEVETLIDKIAGDTIAMIVKFTAFYGFRRSEVLGLKWSSIDFNKGTITVRHAVVKGPKNEGFKIITKDAVKNSSSYRTLPLVDSFRKDLEIIRNKTETYRQICRDSYDTRYEDYIFVNEMGALIDPEYVSGHFQVLLRRHALKRIRFHDLRHSCASMLVRHGVPMKQVQEWLGHSDFKTTANFYSHLNFDAKQDTAKAMAEELRFLGGNKKN